MSIIKIVEVYKTDVQNSFQVNKVIQALNRQFPAYIANFDLQDCDKILRVESRQSNIDNECIISLMRDFGYMAEPLPD